MYVYTISYFDYQQLTYQSYSSKMYFGYFTDVVIFPEVCATGMCCNN